MFSSFLEAAPWKQRFGFPQIRFQCSSSGADKLRLLQAWVLSDETLNFKVKDSSRQDIRVSWCTISKEYSLSQFSWLTL